MLVIFSRSRMFSILVGGANGREQTLASQIPINGSFSKIHSFGRDKVLTSAAPEKLDFSSIESAVTDVGPSSAIWKNPGGRERCTRASVVSTF